MQQWIIPNQRTKRDEKTKITMKNAEEGWIKPMNFALIVHFYNKSNECIEINKNSNRNHGSH